MMSAELIFVFDNTFPDTFIYDTKYDELSFKVKEFDIMKYPINLRNIWYKLYPQLIDKYKKLGKVYSKQNLMNDIETDSLLPFIPLKLVDPNSLKDRVFHKLLEDDYKYQQFTTRADRKHFKFSYVIQYDIPELSIKGWNINHYLNMGLMKLKDIPNVAFDIIDIKYLVQYINKFKVIKSVERFTDDTHSKFIIPKGNDIPELDANMSVIIANKIITDFTHENKLDDFELLHRSRIDNYNKFELKRDDIVEYILNSIIEEFNKPKPKPKDIYDIENVKSVAYELLPSIISRKFKNDSICPMFKLLMMNPWDILLSKSESLIFDLILFNPDRTDYILKKFCITGYWFNRCIEQKIINSYNFKDYWNKYKDTIDTDYWSPTYCGTWIKTYHEEPPLEIYISPNKTCGNYNMNASNMWSKYVNAATIPKEMTSLAYYNYMKQSNGKKRNPNHTVMWSFFSNSDENKLIFCRSDVELLKPARARYNIAVNFDELKPFLHEEVETNGICQFTHLTADDWVKVTGGRSDFDCVVFSDMKNVYRERTPLKQVIQLLNDAVSLQFDVEPEEVH